MFNLLALSDIDNFTVWVPLVAHILQISPFVS